MTPEERRRIAELLEEYHALLAGDVMAISSMVQEKMEEIEALVQRLNNEVGSSA